MFNDQLAERYTWGNRRRNRPIPDTKVGCYVLEHVPTGQLYTGFTNDLTATTKRLVNELEAGKFSHSKFQGTAHVECDILVYEYPTRTIAAAKRLEYELRESITPKYLLTNPVELIKETKRKKDA